MSLLSQFFSRPSSDDTASPRPKPKLDAKAQAAVDEARAEGIAEERARIAAILALPEACDREKLAAELAISDMPAAAAERLLAASPKERGLLAEMAGFKQHAVGSDGGGADPGNLSEYDKGAMAARRLFNKA